MKALAIFISLLLVGCATEKGNQRQAQHANDQIRMVAVQKEAQIDLATKQTQANAALYEALARVAESDPANNGAAVAVALAVIGVSEGQSGGGDSGRVVTLQAQQESEALRYVEALAPTVGALATGLGVAAINSSVQKRQIDATRDVSLRDSDNDRMVVEAVSALGQTAATQAGISVGGDFYDLQDEAFVDNSVNTTTTTTNTTTSVADSYNSQSEDNSLNQGDYGFNNSGEYSDPYTETTLTNTITMDTTVTYQGQETNLASLLQYLQGLGTPYSLSIGGDVIASSSEGTGTTTTIDCSIPQFSPQHPDCT